MIFTGFSQQKITSSIFLKKLIIYQWLDKLQQEFTQEIRETSSIF